MKVVYGIRMYFDAKYAHTYANIYRKSLKQSDFHFEIHIVQNLTVEKSILQGPTVCMPDIV